ncbi:YceK/YidQ family lipoprotein [Pantoea sp. B566]|uniref:YceK/YidQ family lipoprotein n=1 Tax=Pantoea sp. B566 TaxID=2974030 RepID=UPI0021661883|nr:YceK/YidQ family lipoprotein [Pantoea sp. B566]MCS3405468.1 YceK/YidQ family lipoprotein [Pantoea sp. B566]
MNTFAKVILLSLAVVTLSGCGSIISRTVPGQGHGNQFYLGVKWDIRDGAWRVITILDLPLSLVVDTLLIPVDASHGPYE